MHVISIDKDYKSHPNSFTVATLLTKCIQIKQLYELVNPTKRLYF